MHRGHTEKQITDLFMPGTSTIFQQIKRIDKKNIILNLIIIVILVVGIVTVFNNYEWYKTPIVKIERTETSSGDELKAGSAEEKYYDQIMTGTVMNGEYKGQKIQLQNQYSSSGVLDDKYKPGNEVFVKINTHEKGQLTGFVSGFKRDKYMAIFLALFVWLLFTVTSRKGFYFVISLAVNIVVLCYALYLNFNNKYNILMISNCLVLFFSFTSMLFISGLKKKTFVGILSTLVSLCFTMILFQIVMTHTNGVDYTYMEYIAGQNNLSELFLSQILLGGLGAIMDVAITEASAISELVDKNCNISIKELIKSGREVGHDIMGTMINIMLFTYICGTIPLIILKMKNDIKLHTVILWQMPMELYRFLIGSIGIVLTIPVSLFVSIILFKKLRRAI